MRCSARELSVPILGSLRDVLVQHRSCVLPSALSQHAARDFEPCLCRKRCLRLTVSWAASTVSTRASIFRTSSPISALPVSEAPAGACPSLDRLSVGPRCALQVQRLALRLVGARLRISPPMDPSRRDRGCGVRRQPISKRPRRAPRASPREPPVLQSRRQDIREAGTARRKREGGWAERSIVRWRSCGPRSAKTNPERAVTAGGYDRTPGGKGSRAHTHLCEPGHQVRMTTTGGAAAVRVCSVQSTWAMSSLPRPARM